VAQSHKVVVAYADCGTRGALEQLGVARLAGDACYDVFARDEVREALEERIRLVERLNDTRFSSSMARFAELEEADRAIGHRITLLSVRLDELRDQDALLRLEMRRLEEMRIRLRLEQAQQEAAAFGDRLAQLQAELEGDDEEL
jgi:hypothetical protein